MIIEGEDGVTHINIYSKGKTELGRKLSNFAYSPFICEHGQFNSIEGYWYWLGNRDEKLRHLHGYRAKQYGRQIGRIIEEPNFELFIKKALIAKVNHNQWLFDNLKSSSLPFAHYYLFGDFRKDAGFDWIVGFWEGIRKRVKLIGR